MTRVTNCIFKESHKVTIYRTHGFSSGIKEQIHIYYRNVYVCRIPVCLVIHENIVAERSALCKCRLDKGLS